MTCKTWVTSRRRCGHRPGLGGLAAAKPAQTTKYTYYTIGGDTAVEIYNSMMKKGPKVNGAKAYAATSATTTQDGKLLQGSSCQVRTTG